jgi:sodium/bile acid cotransporter 7
MRSNQRWAWGERFWFYGALALVFAVGWYLPGVGGGMKRMGVTPYLVAVAFFLNGFTLPTAALRQGLRQWPLLLGALLLTFGWPTLIVFCGRSLVPGGDTPLGQGLQLLAAVPTTLASAIVLTRIAGGDGAIALYLTVVANLLGVVIAPFLLHLTLGVAGAEIDLQGTVGSLALTVVVPTLVGQLAHWQWASWSQRHLKGLGVLSQVTVLLFILTGLVALPREGISVRIGGGICALVLGLHVMQLGVGALLGHLWRAARPTRLALTLCVGQKSLVLSVFLWERLLDPLGAAYGIAVLPAIAYYIIELVGDSVLAQWWGGQHRDVPATESMESASALAAH